MPGLERKTGWSLAEHAGVRSPDGMQRLFTTARWDQDAVRDDLRGYVAAALGDPGGVLIGDDTGFEKGGSRSAGVIRHQISGTSRLISWSTRLRGPTQPAAVEKIGRPVSTYEVRATLRS